MRISQKAVKALLIVFTFIVYLSIDTVNVSACIEYQRVDTLNTSTLTGDSFFDKSGIFEIELQSIDPCNGASSTAAQRFQNLKSQYGFKLSSSGNMWVTSSNVTSQTFMSKMGKPIDKYTSGNTVVFVYPNSYYVNAHASSSMGGLATIQAGNVKLRFNQQYPGANMYPW